MTLSFGPLSCLTAFVTLSFGPLSCLAQYFLLDSFLFAAGAALFCCKVERGRLFHYDLRTSASHVQSSAVAGRCVWGT